MKQILKYIWYPFGILLKWVKILLSEEQGASVRRVLSLFSFGLLFMVFHAIKSATISGIAIPPENAKVIVHFADIFSWICLGGMGFITTTQLVQIIMSKFNSQKSSNDDYIGQHWRHHANDPMDIENPDAGKPFN